MNIVVAKKINDLLEELYEMTKDYQSRSDFMEEYKEHFNLVAKLNKPNNLVTELKRQKSDLISIINNTHDEPLKYAMDIMVDRIDTAITKYTKVKEYD